MSRPDIGGIATRKHGQTISRRRRAGFDIHQTIRCQVSKNSPDQKSCDVRQGCRGKSVRHCARSIGTVAPLLVWGLSAAEGVPMRVPRLPELLCPPASLPALQAAPDHGADAVYLGLKGQHQHDYLRAGSARRFFASAEIAARIAASVSFQFPPAARAMKAGPRQNSSGPTPWRPPSAGKSRPPHGSFSLVSHFYEERNQFV